jgi:hypothetical protein
MFKHLLAPMDVVLAILTEWMSNDAVLSINDI